MHKTCAPTVISCTKAKAKKGDYTKISFRPDLAQFGMSIMDKNTIRLLSKHAYVIAGSMAKKEGKKLSVYLNGNQILVRDFRSYLKLYDGITLPAAFERVDNHWEVRLACWTGASSRYPL
jgi:DNA topoisomerase-2